MLKYTQISCRWSTTEPIFGTSIMTHCTSLQKQSGRPPPSFLTLTLFGKIAPHSGRILVLDHSAPLRRGYFYVVMGASGHRSPPDGSINYRAVAFDVSGIPAFRTSLCHLFRVPTSLFTVRNKPDSPNQPEPISQSRSSLPSRFEEFDVLYLGSSEFTG